jgi:hypothetical protein
MEICYVRLLGRDLRYVPGLDEGCQGRPPLGGSSNSCLLVGRIAILSVAGTRGHVPVETMTPFSSHALGACGRSNGRASLQDGTESTRSIWNMPTVPCLTRKTWISFKSSFLEKKSRGLRAPSPAAAVCCQHGCWRMEDLLQRFSSKREPP